MWLNKVILLVLVHERVILINSSFSLSLCLKPTVAAEAQLNEEFEMQKISEYTDPENWVHHIPYILPQV